MKKYTIAFMLICITIISYIMFRPSKQSSPQYLTVGMMSGWAPFMNINGNGKYEGFDVDVAQEIAFRMNKKLIIQDLGSLASCFVALEQNRIDLLMSGLDITQKRRDLYNMIYYTGDNTTEFNLVFWNNIPSFITSMNDLQNVPNSVLCAESGSAQEKFLDNYPFIEKKRMNSVNDIILDLRFGKSLAGILEPRIASRLKKQTPELQLLPVLLPAAFQIFGCGIAIKKENTDLAKEVSLIIQDMINDKTIEKLEQKWLLS